MQTILTFVIRLDYQKISKLFFLAPFIAHRIKEKVFLAAMPVSLGFHPAGFRAGDAADQLRVVETVAGGQDGAVQNHSYNFV